MDLRQKKKKGKMRANEPEFPPTQEKRDPPPPEK